VNGDRRRRGDRAIEILAVLLLGIATLGSAWCGYQATQWNGKSSDATQDSSDARVESARLFGLATQIVSYDSGSVAQYAQAKVAGDEELMAFFKESLIRPDFLPTLEQWEQEVEQGGTAPANLLTDEEYLDEQFAPYREAEARAEEFSTLSDEAGATADEYVLSTLLLASALFFAGVTTSFRVRSARLALLALAVLVVASTAARISDLPTL
jgi:hypothetical protein